MEDSHSALILLYRAQLLLFSAARGVDTIQDVKIDKSMIESKMGVQTAPEKATTCTRETGTCSDTHNRNKQDVRNDCKPSAPSPVRIERGTTMHITTTQMGFACLIYGVDSQY